MDPVKLDETVTVDLDKKPEAEQPKIDVAALQAEKAEFERKYNAAANQTAAQRRTSQKLESELAAIKLQLSEMNQHSRRQPEPEAEKDELDRLVEKGEWKVAVSKMAATEAEKLYQDREARRQQADAKARSEANLSTAIQEVTSRYPELSQDNGDDNSEAAKLWNEALALHPEYKVNEFGPILAMREMEKLASERGVTLRSNGGPSSAESQRRRAASASGFPTARTARSTGNKFVLTKEAKEFCDTRGLKYEDYAKRANQFEATGSIEVD